MPRDLAILNRVIRADFSPAVARLVLQFSFPPRDRAGYQKLSEKAQVEALSKRERAELEDYLNVNDLLIVLKTKAKASLRVKELRRLNRKIATRHRRDKCSN